MFFVINAINMVRNGMHSEPQYKGAYLPKITLFKCKSKNLLGLQSITNDQ